MKKAKVFISCGQKTDREIAVGKAVEEYFSRDRGFSTYFAARAHSSDALTTNIFGALRTSEYFVFVDFRRDPIGSGEYRGSLFVNQEVAIATYLGLTGIGFCERLVRREGILQYHIYNEHYFEDGAEILSKLRDVTAAWDPLSANELSITVSTKPARNVQLVNHVARPLSNWYHLVIRNPSKTRHAFAVHGYVSRLFNAKTKKEIQIPTNELIWAGLGEISTNILGNTSRQLDAFFLIHSERVVRFQQRGLTTNNPEYMLPDLEPGEYWLQYSVVSASFETATAWFYLKFDGSPNSVEFTSLPDPP